ncbi:MAG TPA: hypothetical protein PLT26_07080 [Anaerolineaceae bacterium]|nr:hypothetical protein [Anaerolineaceae bacterium]HQH85459.1 hypothetical protein [Anaerolineaceae bacterium]
MSGTQISGWLAWDDVSVSLEEQVITKYDYAGGQRVAVRKDGIIRAYFRPEGGIEYWHRQIGK